MKQRLVRIYTVMFAIGVGIPLLIAWPFLAQSISKATSIPRFISHPVLFLIFALSIVYGFGVWYRKHSPEGGVYPRTNMRHWVISLIVSTILMSLSVLVQDLGYSPLFEYIIAYLIAVAFLAHAIVLACRNSPKDA